MPGGQLVVAQQSGRNIMVDQLDLVIAAIRQAVTAVRHLGTWATPDRFGGLQPTPRHDIRHARQQHCWPVCAPVDSHPDWRAATSAAGDDPIRPGSPSLAAAAVSSEGEPRMKPRCLLAMPLLILLTLLTGSAVAMGARPSSTATVATGACPSPTVIAGTSVTDGQ